MQAQFPTLEAALVLTHRLIAHAIDRQVSL